MNWSNTSSYKLVINSYRSTLIGKELTEILLVINYAVLCLCVCIFGIVTNIINMVIFVKQGLQDTVNMNLLGLAVSDFMSVVTLLWQSVCFIPPFKNSDIPFSTLEVQYLTGDWVHTIFARVSGWITALIMFERLLCVVFPLKVKTIFTAKRIKWCLISFFISFIVIVAPVYISYDLGWKYYPYRNRSLIGLVFKRYREQAEGFSNFLMNLVLLPLSIIIVLGCALGLVIKLNHHSKWRRIASYRGGSMASAKDKKVIKMIMTIAAIFILCFLPLFFIVAWMIKEPEYVVTGRYENMYLVTVSIAYLLEAISSSVNIIVYYHMSSRYKASFLSLFGKDNRLQ